MKKAYWYKFFYEECPVCGRQDSWKERQHTKKPTNIRKRHHYNQVWCHCGY